MRNLVHLWKLASTSELFRWTILKSLYSCGMATFRDSYLRIFLENMDQYHSKNLNDENQSRLDVLSAWRELDCFSFEERTA